PAMDRQVSYSEQVDSHEELSKTMVGAIAIKDRIDGEVFHPDSALAIRGLQPFECVFIAFQRCVDLSQPVGRNVTLPRDCLQFVCDSECFTPPPCRCKGNRDLGRVKWDGKPLETFTIITTDPNALMEPLHDRMP